MICIKLSVFGLALLTCCVLHPSGGDKPDSFRPTCCIMVCRHHGVYEGSPCRTTVRKYAKLLKLKQISYSSIVCKFGKRAAYAVTGCANGGMKEARAQDKIWCDQSGMGEKSALGNIPVQHTFAFNSYHKLFERSSLPAIKTAEYVKIFKNLKQTSE